VLYDDLDPNSLHTGIVRFDGRYYSDLWQICNKRQLVVVADVHTHPAGPAQSISDRANPMIASAGHIAIIIPNFAQPPVRRAALGVYRYMGNRKWFEVPERDRAEFFHIGF
jgi:proteasome lid subunit RPN8/RPN11